MIEHGVHAWDVAALKVIVEEAGGRFTDWNGMPTIHTPDCLASNGQMHDAVLAILRGRHDPVPQTLEWIGGPDGFLRLLDQTRLPGEVVYRDCRTVEDVWEAIRSTARPRSPGDRRRGGLWRRRRRSRSGQMRAKVATESHRLSCARAGRRPSTCSGRSIEWQRD